MGMATELEKGNYFIFNGEPVRVLRREVVVFGTHSHSKLKFYVQGLNEKGEKSVTMHHTDKIEIVDIIRKMGQVISKANDKMQIMDMVSYETVEADADKELFNELNENDFVTFVDFNGTFRVIEKRV